MWDLSVGYDEMETKGEDRAERGRRNGDKLLHSLATGCLKC